MTGLNTRAFLDEANGDVHVVVDDELLTELLVLIDDHDHAASDELIAALEKPPKVRRTSKAKREYIQLGDGDRLLHFERGDHYLLLALAHGADPDSLEGVRLHVIKRRKLARAAARKRGGMNGELRA